jgi:ribonuclease HI
MVEAIFSGKQEQPGVKILGISWNYVTDKMYCDFSTVINIGKVGKALDKLILLSILHSLYDPLGVLIPFTIVGKLAMQLCWKLGLSWKAKLPQEVLDIWQPWAIQIQQINGYSFERTLIPGENPERENKQIHVFADASQDSYAAVAYMSSENRGKVSVRFIQARSRIKPVKATHTVPRMELLSIELGLGMLRKLRTTFDISAHDVFIWTDSRACHDWIRIEARSLQIFVKNRVLKIRQYLKLDQVRWLPGAINPADAATRGITVAELRNNKNWLHGPGFLYNQHNEWPTQPEAATDIYAELLPETLEGVKRDKKDLRISQQTQVEERKHQSSITTQSTPCSYTLRIQ